MNTTKKLVTSALLCALVCVVTALIKVPSPFKGYITLGDSVVVLSAFILPPSFALMAIGIGSALADIFSGYAIYAPVTFVIKGLMPVIIYYFVKTFRKTARKTTWIIIGAFIAELFMVAVYLLFESVLYGFNAAIINVPLNAVQGFANMIVGVLLIRLLKIKQI